MKRLSSNFAKYLVYFTLTFFAVNLTSCSDDDDNNIGNDPDLTGSIVVEDQTISQNTLIVQNVTVGQKSWLVVRKVNEDGINSEMVANPMLLNSGANANVEIELDTQSEDISLEDGDTLVLTLFADDGDGVFEGQGSTGADKPINGSNGSAVSETVIITAPSFQIEDQSVVDNSVTFSNVNTSRAGWIAIHNQNEDGTINEDDIVGWTYVEAGSTDDVVVTFNEGFTYTPGQNIFSRLYMDDPADQEFTFMNDSETDMAENFGFNDDRTITASSVIN